MKVLRSNGSLGDDGYQVGNTVNKDMSDETCDPLYPEFAPNNIGISSGSVTASRWSDWGNDVFDGWGWFYIFNPSTNEYYFPLVSPQNLDDEVISTQTFTAFGKKFTMKQGYPAQGIFKFDISVNDPNFQFIFGAYGELGSDGSGTSTNYTYSYTKGSTNFNLFYNKNQEDGDVNEILYSYFVPYSLDQNNTQTYQEFLDLDRDSFFSIYSVPVTKGITVYFSKTEDVKDWVVHDLSILPFKTSEKITAQSVFNQSLTFNTSWKGFRFYQLTAFKYGFTRMEFQDYRIKYTKLR